MINLFVKLSLLSYKIYATYDNYDFEFIFHAHSYLYHWHDFARNPISTFGEACYRLLCCYIIRQRKYYKQRFELYPKKLFFLQIFIGNLRGWERQWCCPDRRYASQSKGSWEKKIDILNWKHCIVYLNQKKCIQLTWDPVTMTVLPRFSNIKESADAVYERVSVPWNILKQLLIAQMAKIYKWFAFNSIKILQMYTS